MSRMSEMNRREFGLAAAMLAGLSAFAEGQEAGGGTMGASRVFKPVLEKRPSGQFFGEMPGGTFATGEAVKLHLSEVPAGTPKVAMHVNKHSELIVILAGSVSFEHDGVVEEAQPGSVIYAAYGISNRIWNSGTTTARYCVIQIGGDAKA